MTKEQQDIAWACLPKEIRQWVRGQHKFHASEFMSPSRNLLNSVFGYHNLTSDTEPEEMLMVSRKEVQDRVKTFSNPNWASNEEEAYGAQLVIDTLDLLFGDKCLPNEELHEDNFAKSISDSSNLSNIGKDELPSVQVEPKFKYNIGDLVTYKSKIKKVISRELDWKGNATYVCSLINGQSPLLFNEIDLEPYTEPEK